MRLPTRTMMTAKPKRANKASRAHKSVREAFYCRSLPHNNYLQLGKSHGDFDVSAEMVCGFCRTEKGLPSRLHPFCIFNSQYRKIYEFKKRKTLSPPPKGFILSLKLSYQQFPLQNRLRLSLTKRFCCIPELCRCKLFQALLWCCS